MKNERKEKASGGRRDKARAALAPDTTDIAGTQTRLTEALRRAASPPRAVWEKNYQKSPWTHWGVAVPDMDAAIRATLKGAPPRELQELSDRLWREPVWDLKIIAARILARDAVPASDAVWRFVRARMAELDGWAVADNLAMVGSRCLLADPRRLDVVESWVASPRLWTRRATLVFTLPWTKDGRDPERMLGWAAQLADDREWFIQKAIGWWLRELSKRDPATRSPLSPRPWPAVKGRRAAGRVKIPDVTLTDGESLASKPSRQSRGGRPSEAGDELPEDPTPWPPGSVIRNEHPRATLLVRRAV